MQVELVQFQELTNGWMSCGVTGIRIRGQYNKLLQNGWTLAVVYLLRVLQFTICVFHGPLVKLPGENPGAPSPPNLFICDPALQPRDRRELDRLYPAGPSSPSSRIWRTPATVLDRIDSRAVRLSPVRKGRAHVLEPWRR